MIQTDLISFMLQYELNAEEIVAYHLVKKDRIIPVINYVEKHGEPSSKTLESLVKKGLIFKSSKEAKLNNCIANSEIYKDESEIEMELAEELWNRYPAAFPLSGGGMFIARKGPDKYDVLRLYLERIKHDPEKHKFVLEQLTVYVKLVLDSKINGHRIHDWISNEMWDIIPALNAGASGQFKTDI